MERRSFLEKLIAIISSIMSAVVGVPLIGYLIAPALQKSGSESIELLSESELPLFDGEVVETNYIVKRKDGWLESRELRVAYVVKHKGKIIVLSNTCTHAGCGVRWSEKERKFICPCHAGEFDITGKVIKQPPPRPLQVLKHRIQNGKLVIEVEV